MWKLIINDEQFARADYNIRRNFYRVIWQICKAQTVTSWRSSERMQTLYLGEGEVPQLVMELTEGNEALELTDGI